MYKLASCYLERLYIYMVFITGEIMLVIYFVVCFILYIFSTQYRIVWQRSIGTVTHVFAACPKGSQGRGY